MAASGKQAVARLEELVERAVAELKALRTENRELRERLPQRELGAGDPGSWEGDRADLIDRVEKLVGGLDEVLSLTGRD